MASDDDVDHLNLDESLTKVKNSQRPKLRQALIDVGQQKIDLLLTGISEFKAAYSVLHPKKHILRKHIDWNDVNRFMLENDAKTTPGELKYIWRAICSKIKVERPLDELVEDARKCMIRFCKPPLTNGYLEFGKKTIKRLRKRDPHASLGQISTALSEKWKALPEVRKKKYQEKSNAINKEILEEYPELTAASSVSRNSKKLSFKPEIPIPPKNLYAYFSSKQNKTSFKDRNERRNFLRASWHGISAEDVSLFSKEYAQIEQKFKNYLESLDPIRKSELEAYIQKRNTSHTKKSDVKE
ncbi:hypothetical protein MXB_2299 [Myxobolus squamalis]|nr:hypothetical protein MXB_2299 [Myxobolus squamalis]